MPPAHVLDPTASRHAARTRTGQREAAAFAACCAALTALLLLPLAAVPYPGLTDYLNHLARAQVLVDAWLHGQAHPYYELHQALIPNLALDVLVPLLVAAGLDTNDALRLFTALALLLPVAGALAVALALQPGGVPWLALLVFPLAYNRYFAWGFLNYWFGVGLALLSFAAWLRLRRAPARPARLLGLFALIAVAGTLALLSHLMGLGILGLLVLASEWWRIRSGSEPRAARVAPLLAAAAGFALIGAFYLGWFERGLNHEAEWTRWFITRVRAGAGAFVSYKPLPGVIAATCIVTGLGVLAWKHRLRLPVAGRLPLLGVVLAFLLLPSALMGSYFLAQRLAPVMWMLFFASLALAGSGWRVKTLVAAAAFAATAMKTAEVTLHWVDSSARVVQMRDALRRIPQGSHVLTRIWGDPFHNDIYPLRHVASLAIMDRDAYIPNFFGYPFNGESVAFRDNVIDKTNGPDKDKVVIDTGDPMDWAKACEEYDVLLLMIERPPSSVPPACLTPIARGDGFVLFRTSRALAADATAHSSP